MQTKFQHCVFPFFRSNFLSASCHQKKLIYPALHEIFAETLSPFIDNPIKSGCVKLAKRQHNNGVWRFCVSNIFQH